MHKLSIATILIFLFNNLIAQPLRFYDKVDTIKYTSLDAAGDDKGGWLTLGSAEDSSFLITQFDYCGKIIVNEKYRLPVNTKLHTPQIIYSGKDTLVVAATLTSATESRILIFYSVGGIISKAKLISVGANSINFNPVISVHDPTHILLAFNYSRNNIAKSRIVMLDRNLNQRWSKHVETESQIRWIKMLSDTTYAIGDGLKVRKFDTLGNNLWSRIFPEQQMVFNSVLKKDTQLVFLTDYIESDTSIKTKFKQVIGLDVDGNRIWQSNRIRSMRTNSLLEYNSRLFLDSKKNYVFNGIDTLNNDPVPALFAHTLDEDGDVKSSKYWSTKDTVIDYKTTLLNDGNYGVCISFGTSDTLKGFANIKSTATYEGACETKDSAMLGSRSVFMDPINTERLPDSLVTLQPLNIIGRSDSMNLKRVCEVFDLKDGEVPIPLCKGDSVFLAGIQLPNATFDWFNGSKEPGVYVKEAGEYSVKITYCEKTITITYKVTYISYPDETKNIEECDYPLKLEIKKGPRVKYLWPNGDTTSFSLVTGPGTYVVTVTECEAPYKFTFIITTPIFTDNSSEFKTCDFPYEIFGYKAGLIKGATYRWDNGSTDGARLINDYGTYSVTVNYCHSQFVETIKVSPREFFDKISDFNICEYPDNLYAFQGPGINNITYKWDNGKTEALRVISGPGTYKVSISYCGSNFVETFNISMKDFVELKFPNVFPPNSQIEINKIFKPVPNDTLAIQNYNLHVFNRWGKLVFETSELLKGWDGKYDGEEVPMETYMFVATMETRCGVKKYKGTVTLIR